MPLSKQGVRLLKEVKEWVLANPDFYDQTSYAEITPCGTVCCVAGWIDFIYFGPKEHLRHVEDDFDFWESGLRLLGFDPEDASDDLVIGNAIFGLPDSFHSDKKFVYVYTHADSGKDRAEAAASMIDRFIENNA